MSPVSTASVREKSAPALDVDRLRRDFPILSRRVHGKPLVYLDNAATTQKPIPVIEAEAKVYEEYYANVHRGVHLLSVASTEEYEKVREKVRALIGAAATREIVFVRGTTEGINLVAQTYGRQNVGAGDEVLITGLEHHSNIVPWQMLCEEKGAKLVVAPINDRGEVVAEEYEKLLSSRTKIVSFAHVSNALGTINPVARMTASAHAKGAVVLVDGAQAVPRLPVDVGALGCDFYAFSGHKMYGPTGIGVLWGKAALLEAMPPWQGGGDMISSVTFEKTTCNVLPYKFEAGTPNIAGAIALGAAVDYLGVDRPSRASPPTRTTSWLTRPSASGGSRASASSARRAEKAAVLSFTIDGVHPHDIGTVLDRAGVAVRTGHHCAQPVMDFFKIPATARASFALYNTRAEVDVLAAGIEDVIRMFR